MGPKVGITKNPKQVPRAPNGTCVSTKIPFENDKRVELSCVYIYFLIAGANGFLFLKLQYKPNTLVNKCDSYLMAFIASAGGFKLGCVFYRS